MPGYLIERTMKPCIAVVCLLMSCASPQEELLSASQYDGSVGTFNGSRFDGDWRALMGSTAVVQQVQEYRFDCAPFTESFFLRVKSGVAAGFMEADENYSFSVPLDARGRFKAFIPTNTAYTYKDIEIDRESNIVLVLEGELAVGKQSGLFTIGDAAIQGQGCTTQVQFVAL